MSRSLFLGSMVYGLLLAGIAAVRGEFIMLALPIVIYLLAGYLFSPEDIKLEVTRHIDSERTAPDSDVTVTVTIANQGSHLDEVLVEDMVPADLKIRFAHSRHLIQLPRDGSYTFTYRVAGPRGGYGFEAVRVRVNDHLSLTNREVSLEAKGQIFVFPPVMRLRHVAIRPRRTRVYAGTIPARLGGSGTEFFGVREYHPGDPPRAINWRASARHAQDDVLFSNEYQQERVADVGIILDGRIRTNEFAHRHSLFEYSVQAAVALGDALLTQGNRVGLLVYGDFLDWTIPGYGKVQREKLLYALAHARPGGSEVFANFRYLPTRLFPPESQIVLVSPLDEDDVQPLVQLRARGYQVLVISPDPVKFEVSYLPKTLNVALAGRIIQMERALLVQKIQRAGIQVLDWDVSEPFDQVVKQRLSRPPAWVRSVGR